MAGLELVCNQTRNWSYQMMGDGWGMGDGGIVII